MIPARDLDRLVLRLLDGLETDDLEVERLIRMGVHGERSVVRACQRLDANEHTLASKFRRRGLPNPSHLLAWGRLLAAMHAWEPAAEGKKIARRSLEQVALQQRWSSQSVMTTSFRRYTGVTPGAWRRQGATLDGMADLLLRRWHAREPGRGKRKAVAA